MAKATTTTGTGNGKNEDKAIYVVDLGTQSRKRIKNLKRGRGRLLRKIQGILDHAAENDAIPDGAVPVVLVKKERRGITDIFADDD